MRRLFQCFYTVVMLAVLTGCGGSDTMVSSNGNTTMSNDTAPAAANATRVVLQTSVGDITVELNETLAPLTVENFLLYAREGHYDGTIFHRVIDGFMIQGGGFTETYQQKPTYDPVANEADNGLKNTRYSIAMARTSDPQSATSQFFINVADNAFLDYVAPTATGWGYAVFGEVVGGFEVVDSIATTSTGAAGPFTRDVPTSAMVIQSVQVQ